MWQRHALCRHNVGIAHYACNALQPEPNTYFKCILEILHLRIQNQNPTPPPGFPQTTLLEKENIQCQTTMIHSDAAEKHYLAETKYSAIHRRVLRCNNMTSR